jgi:hypothetical protein
VKLSNPEFPNLPEDVQEVKPTVMGPPAYGSPDPATGAARLAPVVDHPLKASLSEDYGADVWDESNQESTGIDGGGASEIDEDEMKLDELKDEAEKRGLAKSGTKAELADRIREYDEAQAALDEDDDTSDEDDQ